MFHHPLGSYDPSISSYISNASDPDRLIIVLIGFHPSSSSLIGAKALKKLGRSGLSGELWTHIVYKSQGSVPDLAFLIKNYSIILAITYVMVHMVKLNTKGIGSRGRLFAARMECVC